MGEPPLLVPPTSCGFRGLGLPQWARRIGPCGARHRTHGRGLPNAACYISRARRARQVRLRRRVQPLHRRGNMARDFWTRQSPSKEKNPTISGDGVKGRRKGMSEKGKSHKAYPPEFKSKCVRSMTLRTRCGHQDGHVRKMSAMCPRAGGHGVRSRAPPAPLT